MLNIISYLLRCNHYFKGQLIIAIIELVAITATAVVVGVAVQSYIPRNDLVKMWQKIYLPPLAIQATQQQY